MILKSVLESLKPSDRARLFHAFDHHFSQHVTLPDGKHFIGVNIAHSHFVVEESAGSWSYGSINKGE